MDPKVKMLLMTFRTALMLMVAGVERYLGIDPDKCKVRVVTVPTESP